MMLRGLERARINSTQTKVRGETLNLFAQRALTFDDSLLIADLHLGKVNHFRKAGVPVPDRANEENIERLVDLIRHVEPARVILLGDLFHSHYNSEWEVFLQVVNHFAGIEFHLVEGNHDILSRYQYEKAPLILHSEMNLGPFLLTHIPLEPEQIQEDQYNLAGHIHPAIGLRGKGRQRLKLPCFYFGANQGFLPAFGNFTGTARLAPVKSDQIFVIVDDQVIRKN